MRPDDVGVTPGQNLGSMWNYLRKYKNNHAKNSLPPATRSNSTTFNSTTLNSLQLYHPNSLQRIYRCPHLGKRACYPQPPNWHCYRVALGHQLFKHKLSPYDEKKATLIFSRRASIQAQASTATPHTHPLFMLPFTLPELTTQIKKLFPDKSPGASGIANRMLQAGDAQLHSLLLLLLNGIWDSQVQPIDWLTVCPSCNQSTKEMPKTKLNLLLTGAYISMTPWPNSLKVSS